MWLGGSIIGPQRGVPASSARLRAQWRQVDVENNEARKVQRQWMEIMGMDASEINEADAAAFDLSLEDELENLSAAITLSK